MAFKLYSAILCSLFITNLLVVSCFTIDEKNSDLQKYREYGDSNDTEECLKLMASTDDCVGRALFLSQDKRPIPNSLDGINDYCSELKSTVECVNNYKKCLKLFSKTFFGLIVRDVKKTMSKICSSGEEKQTVLQHLKCFDESKLPVLYSTISSWTHLLGHMSSKVHPDLLIPHLCCSLHIIENDGKAIINEECGKVTNLDTGAFVVGLVRSAVNDAADLGCGKFNHLTVCEKEMPQQVTEYNEMILQGRAKPFQVTPIVPLLKIAKRLDERNLP